MMMYDGMAQVVGTIGNYHETWTGLKFGATRGHDCVETDLLLVLCVALGCNTVRPTLQRNEIE